MQSVVQPPTVPPEGAANVDSADCVGGDFAATLEEIAMKLLIEKIVLRPYTTHETGSAQYWVMMNSDFVSTETSFVTWLNQAHLSCVLRSHDLGRRLKHARYDL